MADNNATRRDPDQIRQDIADARDRMGTTMGALEYKLNPNRLKAEATDKIREQTVGRVENLRDNASETVKGVSTDVFETIKANPIPAALAAIGLGWLFMERKNQNRMPDQRRFRQMDRFDNQYGNQYRRFNAYDYRYAGGTGYQGEQMGRSPADRARDMASDMGDRAQNVGSQVQDKAQQVAGSVQDTAQQVAENVQDKAQQVAGQAQHMASQAGDQVSEWADTAQQQARHVGNRLSDLMDENPMLVGAAALALGAAIGLSLPNTSKEDELMGPMHDRLMDKAQAVASDTAQKVQQVAQTAGDAAKEAAQNEAEKQNLTIK